jgi:putative hydrolase of the HAD superfamily
MRWDVARDLDRTHGLPRSSVFETLYRNETWGAIERGRGDRQAWLEAAHHALEARAGRALPPLHEEWRLSQRAIEPNLQLVRDLRGSHKLGILSNADVSLRGRLEGEIGIHALFDDIVCSAEVGMAKPEPGIYTLAAERLGLPPGQCVFVDDLDTNVEAARGVGMQAVLFRVDKGDDLRAQLAALGIVPSR